MRWLTGPDDLAGPARALGSRSAADRTQLRHVAFQSSLTPPAPGLAVQKSRNFSSSERQRFPETSIDLARSWPASSGSQSAGKRVPRDDFGEGDGGVELLSIIGGEAGGVGCGHSADSPRTVRGMSADSPRNVRGMSADTARTAALRSRSRRLRSSPSDAAASTAATAMAMTSGAAPASTSCRTSAAMLNVHLSIAQAHGADPS